jgi:exodeoxyribonuclease VII small subunit
VTSAKRRARADAPQENGASAEQPLTQLSFEASLHRLAEIVQELEAGELPLEESLRLFEEGVSLARRSRGILEAAEARVEQLLSVDENGDPIVKALEPDSDYEAR